MNILSAAAATADRKRRGFALQRAFLRLEGFQHGSSNVALPCAKTQARVLRVCEREDQDVERAPQGRSGLHPSYA